MSFKKSLIFIETFLESRFEVIKAYEFQTKANSSRGICWVFVWSYLTLGVSNKSEFLWRNLLSLSLKLSMFMTFKQKRILMKTFVESQFEVFEFHEFQTKANSHEDICWLSVWSYLCLWVSKKSEFWWRHLLSLSLKLFKLTTFKQNRMVMNTFVESHFEVM